MKKSPIEHVANTDCRIKFRTVELKPKGHQNHTQVGVGSTEQTGEVGSETVVATAATEAGVVPEVENVDEGTIRMDVDG